MASLSTYSKQLSIKTASPRKATGMPKSSSTDVYSQSMKTYAKAAVRNPLSFGDTALLQTPSLLGMSRPPARGKK